LAFIIRIFLLLLYSVLAHIRAMVFTCCSLKLSGLQVFESPYLKTLVGAAKPVASIEFRPSTYGAAAPSGPLASLRRRLHSARLHRPRIPRICDVSLRMTFSLLVLFLQYMVGFTVLIGHESP